MMTNDEELKRLIANSRTRVNFTTDLQRFTEAYWTMPATERRQFLSAMEDC